MKCKFSNIEKEELDKAIHDFLNQLEISGSISGGYDLYKAIYGEWEKARNFSE